jgi:hypothetical protein
MQRLGIGSLAAVITGIVQIALLTPCVTRAGAKTLPEPARYYAGSMELAYSDMALFMDLGTWCRDRFPQECGRKLGAAAPALANAARTAKAITVFGHTSQQPTAAYSYASVDQVYEALRERKDSFRHRLSAYDDDLFARYGAVLEVCPDPNPEQARRSLTVLSGLEFMRYRGMSLESYTTAVEAINAAGVGLVRDIKANWTADRCVNAREFGHRLIVLLNDKVTPYTKDGWEKYTINNKFGQGMAYIWTVAVNFQLAAHPEMRAKFDEFEAQASKEDFSLGAAFDPK